ASLSPEMAAKKIAQLEKAMYAAARNLEFEEAARLRDEIATLREVAFGFPEQKAV
ncbi:MAG: UvrB/UvrC motif-containing protein, partial [Gammaproteobacteria bacterium]|nr:UvrB/UvrC motif-containing protein [Gammaproteobacteria bacterium]